MSDMTDASGQMPRRGPRMGDGGSPVSGAVAIVLALVAVVAGFLILNSISDGGDAALDFPADDGGAAVDPGNDTDDTAADPSATTTVAETEPEPAGPQIVTEGAAVVVANANNVGGSAGAMLRALQLGPGFDVVAAVNANPTVGTLDESVIYYDAENPAALDVANSLSEVLGGVESIAPLPDPPPITDGDMQGADVLLMLGNDKAGQDLESLNPDLADDVDDATEVTNPPIAGDNGDEGDEGDE